MIECLMCGRINEDKALFCDKCGGPLKNAPTLSNIEIKGVPIFNEELIASIIEMKTRVDEDRKLENLHKSKLFEYTYQALTEFIVVAKQINLEKINEFQPFATLQSGWTLFFEMVDDDTIRVFDFPKGNRSMEQKEIIDYASEIASHFNSIDEIKEMFISSLIGKPLMLKHEKKLTIK